MPLHEITPGLYETQSPVRFLGVPMSARTTVARLSGGGLFVCSPGALDDELRRSLDELGEVRALAAPNRFHHMFLNAWREAYSDASVHVPGSLPKKRRDLADAELHGDEAPAVYADDLDQLCMRGLPVLDETWFFHRPTKTLIDTDLMHNVRSDPSLVARIGWKAMGGWDRFGPSLLERWLTRDRPALRASLETALEWDFERVLVAHGEVYEVPQIKKRVRESWSWLLG